MHACRQPGRPGKHAGGWNSAKNEFVFLMTHLLNGGS